MDHPAQVALDGSGWTEKELLLTSIHEVLDKRDGKFTERLGFIPWPEN